MESAGSNMNTMHRKIKIVVLLICLVISFTACTTTQVEVDESNQSINEIENDVVLPITKEPVLEEPEQEVLPDPVDIYADFSVKANPDNSFVIETNLPDETELSLTLKGRGYLAQGEAIVKNGRAVSPVFTDKGESIKGSYTLEVLMPIPNVQSDYVKHYIGHNGEYLKGKYVKPALDTVVVEKTFNVQLPEQESIENENSDAIYILNTNTKKFHEQGCSSVKDINEENKESFDGTKEWLEENGYSSCKRCNP